MRHSQRGFSLMEITIVMAIVSVIMIIVYSMIEETMRVTMFNESHNDLAILSQSAVNSLHTELLQTRVAFEENEVGTGYRDALTMPTDVTVWADSLFPVFHADGDIEPDPDDERFTGNSLLIARQLEPLSVLYDDDGSGLTPEVEFLADRYRFEYVYLARSGKSFSESGMTLDLLMSSSGEYADYFQLDAMSTAATSRIVQKLAAKGLTHAWNPGQPVDDAFYLLAGAVDGEFDTAVDGAAIPIVQTRSLLRGLMGGRISGRMNYSVAFIPPSKPFPIFTPLRVFAPVVSGKPGFPSGFEVKIAGPARSRKVMSRVVLMSHYGVTSYESGQAFVVTAARF